MMEKSAISGRNYGIDLLRIFCMFLICILHVCGQGGAMVHVIGNEATWKTAYLLETVSYCAVNTYGMISGYVGVTSRHRPSRIAELWMTVFWYSALGTLIAVFLFHLPVQDDTLFKAVFPTMWKTYWYFSSYVGVFVISPYLNKMVKTLDNAERKRLMITLFLLCSVFTMVPRASKTGSDFLGIGAGYSFLWLAVMYVLGACIRMILDEDRADHEPEKKDFLHRSTGFYVILYTICVLVTWISKFLLEDWSFPVFGEKRYGRLLLSYAGPTVVICAFALLMIFSRVRPGRCMVRVIKFLSPLAFSVYLVQVQPYVWEYAVKGRYSFISRQTPAAAFFLILLYAAILYLMCTLVDLARALVFRILNIRKAASGLADLLLLPFRKTEEGSKS